jgi:predicted nucleic acid-binding protein
VIALDTNTVSELVRPLPSRAVIEWVDAKASSSLVITALPSAEVRADVALVPGGRRKRDVGLRMEMAHRDIRRLRTCLHVGSAAYSAGLLAGRTNAGQPISVFFAQIAAICRKHEAILATRNTADSTNAGIQLVNPWDNR